MMSASGRTSRVQTEEARDGSLSVGLGCLLPCISPPFCLRSPAHGQKILCLMWQRSLEAAKAAAYMLEFPKIEDADKVPLNSRMIIIRPAK